MTPGDQLRLLMRERRRFAETNARNPTRDQLAQPCNLPAEDFQRALQLGVDEQWLVVDNATNQVSEGTGVPPVPTPPGLRIPLVAGLAVNAITPIIKYSAPKISNYLLAPENRQLLRRVVWIICVISYLVLSALSLFLPRLIAGSFAPGIVVTVVLGALFLGITASLFLPSKMIVATFGGLVGVSMSEVGTAAGLISVMRREVAKIAIEISAIINPGQPPPATADNFINGMIWLFLVIVGLLCLPAFFEKET
jgi:hypothetical protein